MWAEDRVWYRVLREIEPDIQAHWNELINAPKLPAAVDLVLPHVVGTDDSRSIEFSKPGLATVKLGADIPVRASSSMIEGMTASVCIDGAWRSIGDITDLKLKHAPQQHTQLGVKG
ncbi:hypothetical protein RJB83_11225 [Staphylococcus epidermidis]|nr:hypothetical protein [Staphylococcus epidermidis]MDH9530788.1 hypothetical protein [Staphylococcus epidermidis]MDS3932014.1 hypothetical protein [Staphylococcus epidermidis]MDS3974917.1 hypothetical protein [Staphylococcus epidermidis]